MFDGFDQHVIHVRAAALGQHFFLAGLQMVGAQRRRVAAAAVEHVEHVARLVEADRGRRHGVIHGNIHERFPPILAVGLDDPLSRRVRGLDRKADAIVVVDDEVGEMLRILLQEPALAVVEVEPVNVEDLRITLVEPDQDFVGETVADFLDLRANSGQRRKVRGLAANEIDPVDVPVLIAFLVLQIDDLPIVVGPEIGAYPSFRVVSDGAGGLGFLTRPHPHVQHPINRRQVGQLLGVGADTGGGAVGIAEQRLPRNQRHAGQVRRKLRLGGDGAGILCLGRRRQQGEDETQSQTSHGTVPWLAANSIMDSRNFSATALRGQPPLPSSARGATPKNGRGLLSWHEEQSGIDRRRWNFFSCFGPPVFLIHFFEGLLIGLRGADLRTLQTAVALVLLYHGPRNRAETPPSLKEPVLSRVVSADFVTWGGLFFLVCLQINRPAGLLAAHNQ